MCALDQKLNGDVFSAVDEKFDLFRVVGKPIADGCSERFNTLDTRASIAEGMVRCNVVCVELRHSINLALGTNNVTGLSYDIGV